MEHSPQRVRRTINKTRESQQADSSLSHRYDTCGKVRDVTSPEPQSGSTAEVKCNQPSALESQADCTLKLKCLPNTSHLMAKHCISIISSFSTTKRSHRSQVTVAEDAASRRLLCSEEDTLSTTSCQECGKLTFHNKVVSICTTNHRIKKSC